MAKNYKLALIWISTVLSVFGLRYLIYGDLFPNTYYLKMGYSIFDRIERSFQWQNIVYFLSPSKYIIPITLIFLYNLFIGGDAWEQYGFLNRFLIVSIPLFYEGKLFLIKMFAK